MWSTTIGRIGTSDERTASWRARSIAVCSNGDSTRSSTVSANAPMSSRVEAVAEPVAEDDCPSADGFGDGGVFAFGVAGDVDAASERDRPCVEGFGEGGFAGADDACEDDVGCGDDAAGVEGPGVVDE